MGNNRVPLLTSDSQTVHIPGTSTSIGDPATATAASSPALARRRPPRLSWQISTDSDLRRLGGLVGRIPDFPEQCVGKDGL